MSKVVGLWNFLWHINVSPKVKNILLGSYWDMKIFILYFCLNDEVAEQTRATLFFF